MSLSVSLEITPATPSVEKEVKSKIIGNFKIGVKVPKTPSELKALLELAHPHLRDEFYKLQADADKLRTDYSTGLTVYDGNKLITSFEELQRALEDKESKLESLDSEIQESQEKCVRQSILYFKDLKKLTLDIDGNLVRIKSTKDTVADNISEEDLLEAVLDSFYAEVTQDDENYYPMLNIRAGILDAVIRGVRTSFDRVKEGN